jgi:Tol biopolymer transport system component
MSAMNTDASGYHSLLTSAANSYVSTAHFSPNGSTIAYDYTDGVHGFYIYTMNSNGTGIITLTGGALKPDSTYSNNTNPSFSPNGSTITYISDVTGTPEIYTMTSSGASITQLTTMVDTSISNVFFTMAGNIAFYATVSGISSWYQVGPTGGGLAPINSSPVNIALVSPWTAYSPSGTTIATSYLQGTGYDLWAFSTNGAVRTKLTSLSATAILAPHYTSDGARIAFEAVQNGTGSIYIVNANGTNLTNLTATNGPDVLLDLH